MKRNEDKLRDLQVNIKYTNTHTIGIPEKNREEGPGKILGEITAENFPNTGKEIINQIQKHRE